MIKIIAPYQLPGYKKLELVVLSEPISSFDNYDLTSIPGSSNLVMAEKNNPLPSSGAATVSYSSTKYGCGCG
jgi:hypothetical protein